MHKAVTTAVGQGEPDTYKRITSLVTGPGSFAFTVFCFLPKRRFFLFPFGTSPGTEPFREPCPGETLTDARGHQALSSPCGVEEC